MFFFQYRAIHVRAGYSDLYQGNPTRFKGRNMLVSMKLNLEFKVNPLIC